MKNFILVAVFILFSVSEYSFAGVKVIGNGGDAVVCYADASRSTIKSVQMFDYWEQPQVSNYGPVSLGNATLSVEEKIIIATNKINKFDPELALQIKKSALNLATHIQKYLVTSYILPEIDDANPKVIPTQPNCYIEQFAIQYKDVVTGQKRFAISDKFYNHQSTSNDDRAGLILHEALYRYSILKDSAVNNSDGIRYINYIIGSDKIERMNLDEIGNYVSFLKNARLENPDCELNQKHTSVLSEIYLSYKFGAFYVCYNQTLKIENIVVDIPSGSEFRTIPISGDGINMDLFIRMNTNEMLRINFMGNIYSSENLTAIWRNSKIQNIGFDTDKPLATSNLFFKGPLNSLLTCKKISYNLIEDDIDYCEAPNGLILGSEVITLNSISRAGAFYEISNLNSKFEILGSKNQLKFIPNGLCKSYPCSTVIDKNLRLVSGGSSYRQLKIKLNGVEYNLDTVEVSVKNGKYFLTVTTSSKEFSQPKIKGLRLVNSGDQEPENSPEGITNIYHYSSKYFCELNGYFNDGSYESVSEYIDGDSEQFFDLAVGKVVYKTDETVNVIKTVKCDSTQITTDNY